MSDRRALVLTTPTATRDKTNGATLRADEIIALLEATGHSVVQGTPSTLDGLPGKFSVGVAVSYACAGSLGDLRDRADRVWLDAVDSWVLVNASGLRSGRTSYLLRAVRDGSRVARMPTPDLVTWISAADRRHDRWALRGRRRFVLPGTPRGTPVASSAAGRRVVLAADWDYPPNRDGLRWFRREVLPRLEERHPADDWHVAVYGTGLPSRQPGGRVRHEGYTDARELYRVGDVHAAPVHFGAGVKRKVLAPLLAGLPVVTTVSGAHGLQPHQLLDVAKTSQDFAVALDARLAGPREARPAELSDLVDADDTAKVVAWLES